MGPTRWLGALCTTLTALGLVGCQSGDAGAPAGGSSASVDDAAARAAAFDALKKELAGEVTNPPEVTPVRWVRPEELQELMDQCYATQGFPKNPGGTMDTPPERMAAFKLAGYTCALRYPVLPNYAQPEGEPQKRAAYAWTEDYLLPCLRAKGFEMRRPVPSEAAFVETWGTAKAFRPYAELADRYAEFPLGNAELAQLDRDCPQNPPSAVLWDGMSVAQYAQAHPIVPAPSRS